MCELVGHYIGFRFGPKIYMSYSIVIHGPVDLFHDEGVVFRPSPKTKNGPFDILRRMIGCVLEFPFPSPGTANFFIFIGMKPYCHRGREPVFLDHSSKPQVQLLKFSPRSKPSVLAKIKRIERNDCAKLLKLQRQAKRSFSSPIFFSPNSRQPDGKTNSEGTHFQNQ